MLRRVSPILPAQGSPPKRVRRRFGDCRPGCRPCGGYLQQGVVAEGATRNAPAFSRFLRIAALANATLVNFTHHELLSHADYMSGEPLAFWRTTSGYEVDFVIGEHTAVEAKANTPRIASLACSSARV